MKLVAYCRVSSRTQEENTSLKDQQTRTSKYCSAMGHDLVAVLAEVGSGKDTVRKQYQKMLDMLPDVDGIIITKLDRLGRSVSDLLKLVDEVLVPANKALVILDLNIDTSTSQGRMILTIMAALNENERCLIAERCNAGRANKKANGGHIGGGENRYGYSYEPKTETIVENPQEQTVIAQMVEWYSVDGLNTTQIAEKLNLANVPAKCGGKWNFSGVCVIFRAMGDLKPARYLPKKIARATSTKSNSNNIKHIAVTIKTKVIELLELGLRQVDVALELTKQGFKSIKGGIISQSTI